MIPKEKKTHLDRMLHDYSQFLKTSNDPDYIPQIKCISDRILLYIRYAVFRCKIMFDMTDENHKVLKDTSHFLYEKVRGNTEYTNGDPRLVAAAIIYMASALQDIGLTQLDISDILYSNPASIRTYAYKMKKLEKL